MIRIGVLISGTGTNLKAIIEACLDGQIDGKVVFVGSDNDEAKGLDFARAHKISTFFTDYDAIIRKYRQHPDAARLPKDFNLMDTLRKQAFDSATINSEKLAHFLRSRALAEASLLQELKRRPFDLLVLAGFMRILTPYFLDRVNEDPDHPRVINIHPALLPAFPGMDGYGDTYRYGCKVGGCTVHFVDYGEDTGPIIGQRAFQIQETDSLKDIKAKGLALEWELYPECIQLFAQGRLRVASLPAGKRVGINKMRKIVRIADAE